MSGSLYAPNSLQPGMTTESYTSDQLIAGQFFRVTLGNATLTGGQGVLARGTLLGQVTASGKYVVATAAANDGSQVPSAILADTYDTSAGDVVGAGLYLTGEFNVNRVTFGAGITAANAFAALRDVSIFLKSSVSAADPS